MSYHQILWILEAVGVDIILIISVWNLTGISAALLPRCLSTFRAIGKVLTQISQIQDFMRSCGKMSISLVNRDPGLLRSIDAVIALHLYQWCNPEWCGWQLIVQPQQSKVQHIFGPPFLRHIAVNIFNGEFLETSVWGNSCRRGYWLLYQIKILPYSNIPRTHITHQSSRHHKLW